MANEGRNFIKERKEAITRATAKQREACAIVYAEHCRLCESNDVKPTPFDVFFAEWLEIEGQPKESVNADFIEVNGHGQNYERMFDGKRGWD